MRYAVLTFCFAAVAAAQTPAPKDLELFLLVGQSNMAGRGVIEAADKEPIPGVYMFTEKMEWAPAIDPLHFDKPPMVGVGIGRSFARTLLKARPGVEIGLIPAAFGGSALEEWCADCAHYRNAITRARAAMKSGHLRGILWHQGEAASNSEELARSYRTRFAKLIERFRKDLDVPDVPVVVGQLGPFFAGKFAPIVNEQLAVVPLLVPNSGFASSARLEHKGDSVHFNTPSLHEFGRRYALAYLAIDSKW